MRGIDSLPAVLPAIRPQAPRTSGLVERSVRRAAIEVGLSEAITMGFSNPKDYSKEIEKEVGLFKTLGWASDTWTVSDALSSEEQSLEDIKFTTDNFDAIMRAELARDTDLYVQVFAFTDAASGFFD